MWWLLWGAARTWRWGLWGGSCLWFVVFVVERVVVVIGGFVGWVASGRGSTCLPGRERPPVVRSGWEWRGGV